MLRQSKRELGFILLFFFLPLSVATYLYYGVVNHSFALESKSYGYLFKPGEALERTYDKRWTVLHLIDKSSSRSDLWQQQLVKMQIMLGPLSESVDFVEMNPNKIKQDLSWTHQLDEGALLVVDNRGFLALGYTYEQEPKRTFIELKKLVKATA